MRLAPLILLVAACQAPAVTISKPAPSGATLYVFEGSTDFLDCGSDFFNPLPDDSGARWIGDQALHCILRAVPRHYEASQLLRVQPLQLSVGKRVEVALGPPTGITISIRPEPSADDRYAVIDHSITRPFIAADLVPGMSLKAGKAATSEQRLDAGKSCIPLGSALVVICPNGKGSDYWILLHVASVESAMPFARSR